MTFNRWQHCRTGTHAASWNNRLAYLSSFQPILVSESITDHISRLAGRCSPTCCDHTSPEPQDSLGSPSCRHSLDERRGQRREDDARPCNPVLEATARARRKGAEEASPLFLPFICLVEEIMLSYLGRNAFDFY